MGKEIIKFGDTEIEKHKLCQHKRPFLIHKVDISEIFVFIKLPFWCPPRIKKVDLYAS